MSEIAGKICLITGCDEGIGLGLARGFLRRGAVVAAGMLDAAANGERVPSALALQLDVTDAGQVNAAVARTIERFGRLDVLINNAGIYPRLPADEVTFSEWRRVLDVNLDGTWRCIEAAIPHLKASQGTIINVGSITIKGAFANLAAYRASKGAIVGLTRALAIDLGKFGIRVNCIHPGAVQTEGEARLVPDPAVVLATVNEHQCMTGRLTPATIEPVFAFLASDDSRDITGQCLTADRGWTLAD